MKTAPIVFALILGWVTGDEHLPADLTNWLTARETIGITRVGSADCTYAGSQFVLRQVLIDQGSVGTAEP